MLWAEMKHPGSAFIALYGKLNTLTGAGRSNEDKSDTGREHRGGWLAATPRCCGAFEPFHGWNGAFSELRILNFARET
jgi:hypothetical protein